MRGIPRALVAHADRRRRAAPACALLALAAALVAGCGGGGAASYGDARALAFAEAVNLRAADVPGMQRGAANSLIAPHGNALPCSTLPKGRQILSRPFVAPGWGTFSLVVAAPSAAAADAYVAGLDSSHTHDCLAASAVEGAGSSSQAQVSSLSAALPRGHGYAGVRTVVPTSDPRLKHLYVDIVFFAAGRAVVGLVTIGREAPAPQAAAQHLLAVLDGRARAHGLP